MNKYIKIASVVGVIALLASCKKYITYNPHDQYLVTALDYLQKQDFIRKDAAVVIGHSAGGWGALALANADPKTISAIIALAPGRGGHANDEPNKVCAPHFLDADYTAQVLMSAIHALDHKHGYVKKSDLFQSCINRISCHVTYHAVQEIQARIKAKAKENGTDLEVVPSEGMPVDDQEITETLQ